MIKFEPELFIQKKDQNFLFQLRSNVKPMVIVFFFLIFAELYPLARQLTVLLFGGFKRSAKGCAEGMAETLAITIMLSHTRR